LIDFIRRYRLSLVVFVVNLAVLGALLWLSLRQGGGLAYPLDDTYIHAVVARNLVEHGSWGINPGEFASASSAPGWVVLLASGYALFGASSLLPGIFSVLAGGGALLVAEQWMHRAKAPSWQRLIGLTAVSVLVPLPSMMGTGMEHTLQLLLVLLLARYAEADGRRGLLVPLLLAAVLPMIRYESCLLIGWLGLSWMLQRRWRDGGLLWAVGAASVLLFGAWSVANGASGLPNGMLMKSMFPHRALENIQLNLREGAPVWLLALTVWGTALRGSAHMRLFVLTAVSHLLLARVGWFYRYEAYLMGWGALLLSLQLMAPGWRRRWLLGVGLVVASGGSRVVDATRYFPGRSAYILDVKVRLAEALDAVAPDARLALHDIGAMAWYTDVYIIDVAGLGDDEVTRLSVSQRFTGENIAALAERRGAQLGFAAEAWMSHDRLPGWQPVASFRWSPDHEHFVAHYITYAVTAEGADIGTRWMEEAAARMDGRAVWESLP
jgi:hypothetical protein